MFVRVCLFLCVLVTSLVSLAADKQYHFFKNHYFLRDAYHYTQVFTTEYSLLTDETDEDQRYEIQYDPKSEVVKVLEAFVTQPQGEKLTVAADQIFTRDSSQNPNAPGFNQFKTTTIVFPQLKKGSRLHIKYERKKITPDYFKFYLINQPPFDGMDVDDEVVIHAPASLRLHWRYHGPYVVKRLVKSGRQVIRAHIRNYPEVIAEENMVDMLDVLPYFMLTAIESQDEIAQVALHQYQNKFVVTPEIKTLADKLTQGKKDRAAIEAVYYWVIKHIHYLSVSTKNDGGIVPNAAATILQRGYGDCKDHAAIFVTLLRAVGIEAYTVSINSGYSYRPLPLAVPRYNHLIVYLPGLDMFADPTDPYSSFGTLDVSNAGKLALIEKRHAELKRTPVNQPQAVRYQLQNHFTIAKDGSIQGEGEIRATHRISSLLRGWLASAKSKQLASALLAATPEGGRGNYHLRYADDPRQPLVIKTSWTSPAALSMTKEAYFTVPLGIDFQPISHVRALVTEDRRRFPLVIGAASRSWSYNITLPEGAKVIRVPPAIKFENKAGHYKSRYVISHNHLAIVRKLMVNRDVFATTDYLELKQLLQTAVLDQRGVLGVKLDAR